MDKAMRATNAHEGRTPIARWPWLVCMALAGGMVMGCLQSDSVSAGGQGGDSHHSGGSKASGGGPGSGGTVGSGGASGSGGKGSGGKSGSGGSGGEATGGD